MNWRERGNCPTVSPVEKGLFLGLAVIPSSLNTPHAGEGELLITPFFSPLPTDHTESTGGKNGTSLAKAICITSIRFLKILFSFSSGLPSWLGNEALKASNPLSFSISLDWQTLILLFTYQTSLPAFIRSIWVENHFTHNFSKADITFSGWLKGKLPVC